MQQPYEFATVGISTTQAISLYCSVYPNPTAADVMLKIELPVVENFSYELVDLQGKLLLTNSISSNVSVIPFQNFARATYLLRVMDKNTVVKTFKIIKNQ